MSMNARIRHQTTVTAMLHVLIYLGRSPAIVNLDLMETEPIALVWLDFHTSIFFFWKMTAPRS